MVSSVGVHTKYFEADLNYVSIARTGSTVDVTITNISVLEITDDTNLPRINYSGFTYQDSLGSELIVNGDFSNGSTDWYVPNGGWSVSNNTLIHDGSTTSATGLQNINIDGDVGTIYKLTLNVVSATNADLRFYSPNVGYISQIVNTGDTLTYLLESNGSYSTLAARNYSGAEIILDNVSVKEYLGQEVVPDSGCGAWLFEPQSTNIVTQSELFSDGSWDRANSSVVSGFSSPSGDLNSFKLINNATASVNKYIRTIPTATNGIDYSLSVFAKKGEYDKLRLEDGNNSQGAWFDLSNGTLLTVGGTVVAKIEDYGNGWYRCSITKPSITTSIFVIIAGSNSQSLQVGDGTSGIYIWGAQLEGANSLGYNGEYATSYIPTEGTIKTRNQRCMY